MPPNIRAADKNDPHHLFLTDFLDILLMISAQVADNDEMTIWNAFGGICSYLASISPLEARKISPKPSSPEAWGFTTNW